MTEDRDHFTYHVRVNFQRSLPVGSLVLLLSNLKSDTEELIRIHLLFRRHENGLGDGMVEGA